MNFSVIARADITITEFAKIMRTSRTTVHSWMKGGGIHAMISTRLKRTLDLLEKAVEAGDLPLTDTPRRERIAAIAKIIKTHNAAQSE